MSDVGPWYGTKTRNVAAAYVVETCSVGKPIAVISAAIQYGRDLQDLTLNGNPRWWKCAKERGRESQPARTLYI
jgi:hypothetical protein